MAEPDLAGIIKAFREKEWVIYKHVESDRQEWGGFLEGPVAGLNPGETYRVIPAAENPNDLDAAEQELCDMATYGSIDCLPALKIPGEEELNITYFSITSSDFVVDMGGGKTRPIPLGDVERLVRDHFTTYDRENTRREKEKHQKPGK